MNYYTASKINAAAARKATVDAYNLLIKKQIELVYQTIQTNVRAGKYKCSFEGDMYSETMSELRESGYTVTQNTDIDFLSFNISW